MLLGGFLLLIIATAFQGEVGHLVQGRAFFLPNFCMYLNFQVWALENQISLHNREILSCKVRTHRWYPGERRRK